MTRWIILFFPTIFILLGLSSNGQTVQNDSITQNGLITENTLHPADGFTAYTFNKGEWQYFQPISIVPAGAMWGITDWLTTEIDIETLLGGFPSFNFRFRLAKQNKIRPALAFETQYMYLTKEIDILDGYKNLSTRRQWTSWDNRLNASWKLADKLHLHLSCGAIYEEKLIIEHKDSLNYKGKTHNKFFSPDISVNIDWRVKKWIAFHAGASYGSTFMYLDNCPLKQEFIGGTRIAPFLNSRFSFFRCFRFEAVVISIYFTDADQRLTIPFGYLYWQWDWSRHQKEKK